MIDRHARDIAAKTLRDFMEGSISNEEYERKYPRSKDDPALWEIYIQVWFFYSDIKTHKLTGKHELNEERLAFVERCILFAGQFVCFDIRIEKPDLYIYLPK